MTDEELKAARALVSDLRADAMQAARTAVNFYVEHWYVRPDDVEASLSDDGPVGRLLDAMPRLATLVPQLLDEVERREVCWSCPDCAFTYAAYHVLTDGSHACPVCEAERLRAELLNARFVNASHIPDMMLSATNSACAEAERDAAKRQRDEALALMERYRAVAVAAALQRDASSAHADVVETPTTDRDEHHNEDTLHTYDEWVRAADATDAAVDIARAAGLLTDEDLK